MQCPEWICLVQCDSRFVSRKLSRNRHCADWTAWLEWFLYHLQWQIWFIVIRQTKHDSNAVYCSSDPTNMGFFSPSLSLPPKILPKSTLSQRTLNKTQQDVLKQPKTNTDFFVIFFRLRVIIKALLKQISQYLLSYFRIRIIVLTCPDNESARNHQPKSCVPAKSHRSQWC